MYYRYNNKLVYKKNLESTCGNMTCKNKLKLSQDHYRSASKN